MAKPDFITRNGERVDFKRCPRRWGYRWRLGLVPKRRPFGALSLGTWVHQAFQTWYGPGLVRGGLLAELVARAADKAMHPTTSITDSERDTACELRQLAIAMLDGYQRNYGSDQHTYVVGSELPLFFNFPTPHGVVAHRLTPDLIYRDTAGGVWLMEHKTATSIRTEHLQLDDQARGFAAMAAAALVKAGVCKREEFRGITYNFLRKAYPDDRAQNAKGQYLNKNGTVSKSQPPALFVRLQITIPPAGLRRTLERIRYEVERLAEYTTLIRSDPARVHDLPKTPDRSCPRSCEYFRMCVMDENGIDTGDFRRLEYRQEDPYLLEESTDNYGIEFGI